MSFEQDFIHGYEKHSKIFDKWCEKASSILGNVTQCGINELDSAGNALIAINRPDFGEHFIGSKCYLLDSGLTYSLRKPPAGFETLCSNEGMQFILRNEEALFGETFGIGYGFTFSEKIDSNTKRNYFFGSDTPIIYEKLLNNMAVVKKFIKYFKQENECIINDFRDRKFNLAEKKKNYFIDQIKVDGYSERRKMVNILHTLNVLDQDMTITAKEWQILNLCALGESNKQVGERLHISKGKVNIYLKILKAKLKIEPNFFKLTYITNYFPKSIFSVH